MPLKIGTDLGLTPSQTVGPYFAMRLPWPDGPYVVPAGTPEAIIITGRVYDGAGNALPDAMIETWQADPDGRFAHPDDPRGATPGGVPVYNVALPVLRRLEKPLGYLTLDL